ncbi:MAG: acetylglutamate kinase [Spirochaetaceae bacterium]
MKTSIEKAEILREALPYIRRFSGATVVIKYGGSAMKDPELLEKTTGDIALLKYVGMKPVVVHGGGPAINEMLERVGVKSTFLKGLRVTDEATMEITEMVLSGKVNKRLVRELCLHGVDAVGITGEDGGLFTATPRKDAGGNSGAGDLGFVGDITSVNPRIIEVLLCENFIPVIAPVSMSMDGTTYNINADEAAVAAAGALKAEKLVYLSDVPGILRDPEDPESLITAVTRTEVEALVSEGTVSGGMVPKVNCALHAVDAGVGSVHILDGRIPHSLLLEVFTQEGVGTLISREAHKKREQIK